MILLLWVACANDTPAWAVNHASVEPTDDGLSGTQTWEFFRDGWTGDGSEKHFVCARVQSWEGAVIASPEGCGGCVAAYQLEVAEIETDCPTPYATDPAYAGPAVIGIGDTPESLESLNPHAGDALGWYAGFGTTETQAFGFAWDEALDYGESAGPPGWRADTIYTLWPAVAWDLGG